MEQLIALQDINGTIKAGERFEAPDLIYVALGLAERYVEATSEEPAEEVPMAVHARRRGRGRQTA